MTKYTRKNGKVVLSESNIAKMNVLEVMYYSRHIMEEGILNYFNGLFELLTPTIILITLPISYPIMAYMRIVEAKKIVKRQHNRSKLFIKHQDEME